MFFFFFKCGCRIKFENICISLGRRGGFCSFRTHQKKLWIEDEYETSEIEKTAEIETNVALDFKRVSPEKSAPLDFKDDGKGVAGHGKRKYTRNDKNLLIASYVAFDFEEEKKKRKNTNIFINQQIIIVS